MGVDELRTVVGVDAQDRERELGEGVIERGDDMDRGLVHDAAVHGPTGRDVRDGQGEAELAEAVTAPMADQVDLDEARGASSHSDHVRIGICDLSNDPGFGWERPANEARDFAPCRRRSIVAADMAMSRSAPSSLRS